MSKKVNRKLDLPMFKVIDGIKYKLCSKCGEYKEATTSNFSKSSINNSGLRSSCKYCCSVTARNPNHYRDRHFNSNGLLLCKKCNTYKSVECFDKSGLDKHRDFRNKNCKECEATRKFNSRISTNPIEDLDKLLRNILRGCKSRCKGSTKKGRSRGKEFLLDIDFLKKLYHKQNGLCAISGIPMTTFVGHGRQIYNISIDRIDSNLGYTKDNVQLVCAHINMMKADLDTKVLLSICNKIILHNGTTL
jgi:hypothetical protein